MAVRRCSLGRDPGDAERRRRDRPRLRRLGVLAAARHEAGPPDVQPRRAGDPRDDRRRRPDRVPRDGLRDRGLRRSAGGLRRRRARRSAPRAAPRLDTPLEAAFWVFWWAHMALVAAFLVYLPFSKHLHIATSFPNIYFRKLAPRGELPADGPRGGGRDVRAEDPRRSRLEGHARRLHLHRVRPLPAGVPGLEHRQAAQPQDTSSWASGTCRSRPSTASP